MERHWNKSLHWKSLYDFIKYTKIKWLLWFGHSKILMKNMISTMYDPYKYGHNSGSDEKTDIDFSD